jgi:hypothetical protein
VAEFRGVLEPLELTAKFHELMRYVDHHVAEEEVEIFPRAEAELEADMQELRDEMQALKAQLLAS